MYYINATKSYVIGTFYFLIPVQLVTHIIFGLTRRIENLAFYIYYYYYP